jgi:hypothetical protein
MPRLPSSNFAPHSVKVIGCLALVPSFPLLFAIHSLGPHPVPWVAFIPAGIVSLSSLSALLGRPTLLDRATAMLGSVIATVRSRADKK